MRVNISDLKLEAGSHKTVPVQIAIDAVDMSGQEITFDRPFTGSAEIWNAGDRLLVRAAVSGEATVPCSRCPGPFSLPLEVSFEEEFAEGEPPDEDAELDMVEAEQRTVTYYRGDEIDLSEPLRENVLLELPMKALCQEDCQGLCPTCGTNLNEGECQCGTEATHVVDPRLAALKDLLRKPDSNS